VVAPSATIHNTAPAASAAARDALYDWALGHGDELLDLAVAVGDVESAPPSQREALELRVWSLVENLSAEYGLRVGL
jgi:hypothetical protein